MRNFKKLKTKSDYDYLDPPQPIAWDPDLLETAPDEQMILRMLVRPKYGGWEIPEELNWLIPSIWRCGEWDRAYRGIDKSWCYVTVRHGPLQTETDDEWHFDGASFRTDIIPERNYVWVDSYGPQFKMGNVPLPEDFDPTRHNLFSFYEKALKDQPVMTAPIKTWLLMSPFCFHRRNPDIPKSTPRTFIRISFPDIEARDMNNTPNPLLGTPAYGRDPVRTYRDKLEDYDGVLG